MKRDSISTEALVSMDPELKAAILARDSDRVLAIWHEMKQTRSEEWHQNKAKFEALMALLIDHGYNSGWQLWTKWQQGHLDDRLVQWLLTKEITKLAFHHTKYQHIDDLLDKLILGSEWVECISRLKLHYLSCVKPPTLSTLDLCLSRYQNLEKLELGDLDLNALGQSITTLSKLAEIDLYGNQLTEFPQQLCQLLMLKKINLRRNPSLQGRIPPEIANLNQLQDLDLGDTMMIDIRHLENLPQLSRLSIEQRWRKSEVPHRIEIFPRSLPALKRITLSSDNFAGMIPALPQSQCLEIEILGGNIAVDLSLLAQLQNLRSLSISGSSIVNLNALVNLQNLEDLDLCANCDVLDLEPIFQIKSLQSLEISGNPMTPILDRFDELPNLTRVIVRNMKLQTLPETLVRHPQLHMLDPNDNNFSSSYEDYLEENCAAYANRPIDMAYQ